MLNSFRHLIAPQRKFVRFEVLVGAHAEGRGKSIFLPEGTCCITADYEAAGLDYGAIRIPCAEFDRIERAGARACGPEAYRQVVAFPDLFIMLGFPKERRLVAVAGRTPRHWQSRMDAAMLPLVQVPESYEREPGLIPRFRARLATRLIPEGGRLGVVASLNGMSGGPIFAIQTTDPDAPVSLVAIQSTEANATGVIAGCYVRLFMDFLEATVCKGGTSA